MHSTHGHDGGFSWSIISRVDKSFFGTCICSTCWDQSFSELVVILPDYALRLSLGSFSILLLHTLNGITHCKYRQYTQYRKIQSFVRLVVVLSNLQGAIILQHHGANGYKIFWMSAWFGILSSSLFNFSGLQQTSDLRSCRDWYDQNLVIILIPLRSNQSKGYFVLLTSKNYIKAFSWLKRTIWHFLHPIAFHFDF